MAEIRVDFDELMQFGHTFSTLSRSVDSARGYLAGDYGHVERMIAEFRASRPVTGYARFDGRTLPDSIDELQQRMSHIVTLLADDASTLFDHAGGVNQMMNDEAGFWTALFAGAGLRDVRDLILGETAGKLAEVGAKTGKLAGKLMGPAAFVLGGLEIFEGWTLFYGWDQPVDLLVGGMKLVAGGLAVGAGIGLVLVGTAAALPAAGTVLLVSTVLSLGALAIEHRSAIWGGLSTGVRAAGRTAVAAADATWDLAVRGVRAVGRGAGPAIDLLGEGIDDLFDLGEDLWRETTEVFGDAVEAVSPYIQSILQRFSDTAGVVATAVQDPTRTLLRLTGRDFATVGPEVTVTRVERITVNGALSGVATAGVDCTYEISYLSDGRVIVTEVNGGSFGADVGVGATAYLTAGDRRLGFVGDASAGGSLGAQRSNTVVLGSANELLTYFAVELGTGSQALPGLDAYLTLGDLTDTTASVYLSGTARATGAAALTYADPSLQTWIDANVGAEQRLSLSRSEATGLTTVSASHALDGALAGSLRGTTGEASAGVFANVDVTFAGARPQSATIRVETIVDGDVLVADVRIDVTEVSADDLGRLLDGELAEVLPGVLAGADVRTERWTAAATEYGGALSAQLVAELGGEVQVQVDSYVPVDGGAEIGSVPQVR